MDQYHAIMQDILSNGYITTNRTTQPTLTLPYGAVMKFDMAKGFPAVTSKELFFAGAKGEIIGFLRGYTHADEFAALGCNWWAKDANKNTEWLLSPFRTCDGDLGRIYGAQWRRWKTSDGFLDQVQAALDAIRKNPDSRRIVISAWRPDEFRAMALPPCHVLYRFQVDQSRKELSMSVYQRSCDMFLGVPMNMAGAGLMLHLFAAATGLKPRWLTHHLDDTHIYANAIEAVEEQLTRSHYLPPALHISKNLYGADANELAAIEPHEITLEGYQCHPAIKGVEMVTG